MATGHQSHCKKMNAPWRCLVLSGLMTVTTQPVGADANWGVVFDCGSSGTRAAIYHWSGSDSSTITQFVPELANDEALLSVEPGISSFAADHANETRPAGAQPYFAKLLAQVARWVPGDSQGSTRVRALATAGMRLLSEEKQDSIWSYIRAAIEESSFDHQGSSSNTIGGEYEGIFNWLAVQFALESRAKRPVTAFGALDLGGASTQITFKPESGIILQNAYRLANNGAMTRLYSHSYMRHGQDQAILRYAQLMVDDSAAVAVAIPSPCFFVGLNRTYTLNCGGASCERVLYGTGDFEGCRAATARMLNRDYECLVEPCAAQGVYQPPAYGVPFYASAAYYYTADGVGLMWGEDEKGISTNQLAAAGQTYCSQPYSAVEANRFALETCFSSAYIPSLLDAFGIPPNDASVVTYVKKIGGMRVGWPLGAQIYFMTNDLSAGSVKISEDENITIIALGVVLAVAGVLLALKPNPSTNRAAKAAARRQSKRDGSTRSGGGDPVPGLETTIVDMPKGGMSTV